MGSVCVCVCRGGGGDCSGCLVNEVNSCPAEPGYTLLLQTV